MAARKNKVQPVPITEQIRARLQPYQREIIGGGLMLFTSITLLSLFSLTEGRLSTWWAELFTRLFGWGAVPATVLLGAFGVLLLISRFKYEDQPLPFDVIVGLELLFVTTLALAHLLAVEPGDFAVRLARQGGGGGFVGWGVSNFFVELVGGTGAILLLALLALLALALTFRVGMADAAAWAELLNSWARRKLDEQPLNQPAVPVAAPQLKPIPAAPKPKPEPKIKALPAPSMSVETALATMPPARRQLPPIDLLAPPAQDPTRGANARYQAQIIEDTLRGFGIPAEVAEINSGPTVTQFGLKLGTLERKLPDGDVVQQRIRVNKVAALSNDLALALSAAPIRIETPVPGRPLVGIEVPNAEKTMVSLRAVVEDQHFQKSRKPLLMALGKNVAGQAVSASLSEMPHLLIAGATGSGKSVCVNALICTLLITYAPEQLRFLMVDPKMVELTSFNGIPHLIAPVVTDFDQVVGALAWVTREMERRYKLFAKIGARSLGSYNKKVSTPAERLPYLVVVIDELADLMMMAPDEVERSIARIAQMARATGIHLIIATQRPSVDVVTGLIKANFPTRIAFAVTSQIDSRVILDTPGAEKLLGRGDMLYMAPDSAKLARLQGCFVSDVEISNIVNFWKAQSSTPTQAVVNGERVDVEPELPWADIMAEADKDDMLEEAVKLVVESGRASTSLLQRRLGIGYPRASRLMDQLEEEGIIGPANGAKPREVLWQDDEDAADEYAEFEQDLAG
ncbi:MAG: hypothetical protein FOGNACKC_04496 [Anaerolineae bacterium]|nr:hypothetical protein [Anaerolineae bacterium]